MRITNIHDAPLGFGAEKLMPDRTIDTNSLPRGYDENHPLVKYYIRQGWLKVVGTPANDGGQPVNVSVGINANTGESGAVDEDAPAANKPISRMTKTELRTLASNLGIEFPKDISNPALRDMIKAAQATTTEDVPPDGPAEADTGADDGDEGSDSPDA